MNPMTPLTMAAYTGSFLLGAILAVQLLAAFFRIIDLWYGIRRYLWRVIRPILGWGTVLTGIMWFLPLQYRSSFHAGIAAFLLFNLLFFMAGKILTAVKLRNALRK